MAMTTAWMKALLVSTLLSVGVSHAAVIHCESKDDEDLVGIKVLAYDTARRTASATIMGKTYQGRITLIRPHSADGGKINMAFPSPYSFHDSSARMELMTFPITKSEHRVVGAVTIEIDGVRHIDVAIPNVLLTCRDLAL